MAKEEKSSNSLLTEFGILLTSASSPRSFLALRTPTAFADLVTNTKKSMAWFLYSLTTPQSTNLEDVSKAERFCSYTL